MKAARTFHDWFVSIILTAVLHLVLIKTAVLPPGNYFLPFFEEINQEIEEMPASPGVMQGSENSAVATDPSPRQLAETPDDRMEVFPYRRAIHHPTLLSGLSQITTALPPFIPLSVVDKAGYRSLVRQTAVERLAPPRFSGSTIPARPEKSMGREVEEDAEAILLGNVFQDAIPATSGYTAILNAEAEFLQRVQADIADGRLDMPFATFILSAEYYHLSRAMMPLGQQPSFPLAEAMARYNERLQKVGEGLPKEIDGFTLVMLLQRYAENKFYPGNGSGMLLDSLFHWQNDCEGGTKEVLAYLQTLYPALELGSNRGMLQTTTGELIGHMQVFIGPGPASGKILASDRGLIVETTRVGLDSIRTYASGEVFPLEDFVVRYYPEIVAGTPLAGAVSDGRPLTTEEAARIVGSSDHPLKMNYGASTTLLAEQLYDLDSIRTQRIDNEFLRSKIPSCNPRIDPTKIDRTNLFSNFVAIDRKLRKSLIGHYLADLQYWDNQIMPQWRQPEFLATYDDLAGSLLADDAAAGYIQVDAENSLPFQSLQSHGRLLKELRGDVKGAEDRYLGTGRQECARRTVLDDRLLGFLFTAPEGPGVFFLPAPDENLPWSHFLGDIIGDCLAVPATEGEHTLLGALEKESEGRPSSFRKELYDRALLRGLNPPAMDGLAATTAALADLLTGTGKNLDAINILAQRQSPESTLGEPSVAETLAELGRTGINSGLMWDIADFLGSEKMISLFLQYGGRGDLHLTIHRAQQVAAQLGVTLGDRSVTELFASLTEKSADKNLRLAAAMNLAKLQGLPAAEISRLALAYLQNSEVYRAETLVALLQYGLLPEDGLAFVRTRVDELLARLPKLSDRQGAGNAEERVFSELLQMVLTLRHLPDKGIGQALHGGLSSSLLGDFKNKVVGKSLKTQADWGVLFNKLLVLALLHEEVGEQQQMERLSLAWLQQFISFAADNPIGKLMLDPVLKIAGKEGLTTLLGTVIPDQLARLDTLRRTAGQVAGSLPEVKALLGEGNVIVRMLLAAEAALVGNLSGLPVEQFVDNPKNKGAWYLEKLHRRIVPIISGGGKGTLVAETSGEQLQRASSKTDPLVEFYVDDRVRESFAMLAYLQVAGESGNGVKFMKTQDLAAIKDPSKLRVVEGERKITRQDMSMLTLALNPGNHPSAIRRAWEETLAVTDKHLGLNLLDQGLRGYLFAPHYPYLTENDSGFFFSPETIEDLHNAALWGGRNDILLSSYLHFRHLPGQLPDWLRRTAMARSELELQIIKKFEQQSFLPMILQCDSDKNELPEPLFRAKWAIRKPFGEDIFPGTLLLLRLGYLEITAAGEIVRTPKYAGG